MHTLLSDLSKIPSFVEEMLRLEAPIQGLFRMATADTELDGVSIPKGSHIWVAFGSGNYDAEVFECPEQLDMDRANARSHLAFGGRGPHVCIGATLARSEAQIALETLLQRLGHIALGGLDRGYRIRTQLCRTRY